MNRGEVRWFTFARPDKRRPVLVLTRNSVIGVLSRVTVAPITTTIRGIPTEVVIGEDEGLRQPSAVNLDNIQTVPRNDIGQFIGALSPARMRHVEAAIAFALGFDETVQ
ncbi:MAG: type II toxin-antitoxin system PemK/MazF family toxin [Dehalococcoidia bacterium]|nr:type II toxin-antitoxin system PemK/MazF family toxin [Dehalococcoidia bacterium]MCL4230194.1 type II toxin-antitoxin system PemK/MazF family toxin [Dehalococcoidia bacterium]NUQ55663.1 type II toxin-antitoxin system PemK/MazF family toxin [Dehalococcoidia bacterium]